MPISADEIRKLMAEVAPAPMPTQCMDCKETLVHPARRPFCDKCESQMLLKQLRRLAATDSRFAAALAQAEAAAAEDGPTDGPSL